MYYIIPFILLVSSVGIFFSFIRPLNDDIGEIRNQSALLNDALTNTRRIQSIRDALLEKYNAISVNDLGRVKKMLPDHVDNVRMILEIDKIASRYGMVIQDIGISEDKEKETVIGKDERPFGMINLDFTITGTYDSFRNFVVDLERGLRIVDVRALGFNVTESGFMQFHVTVRTYWLKS